MSIQQIKEAIKSYETIIIHRHVRPDPDALGSQGALKEIIQATYPNKKVYSVGEDDPSLTFLTQMEQIKDEVYKKALVIVCDTANRERIDDSRYELADTLIKIDHHPVVDDYGDIRWVDTNASSTSEMIYEFYLQAKQDGFKLNDEAARLIYAGIVGDTGRFLFPSTTKKTLQYAADIVTYSFDVTSLYDNLYRTREAIARLKGYILQNYQLSETGVSSIKLTKEILADFNVKPIETGQIVGIFGNIDGIRAWAVFVEEESSIRVRMRSKGPAINKIAEKYEGGGHPLAAGATIYDWEDMDKVIRDLESASENDQHKR